MSYYRRAPLYAKILIGMILGIIIGLIASSLHLEKFVSDWIGPWGTIFIKLLKFIAVPLVFLSLIHGVTSLKSISSMSRLGIRTISLYLTTTVIAVILGLLMVNIMKPGDYFPTEKSTEFFDTYKLSIEQREQDMHHIEEQSPLQFIVDIIPDNLFSSLTNNSNMLQVIFIAIIIGVAICIIGKEKTSLTRKIIDEGNIIMMKITHIIMEFAPIGVLCLMADLITKLSGDMEMFAALGMYALTVIISLLIITFIIYPTILYFFTKRNIKDFYKTILPVQILAFSSSSSSATLPLTIECAEKGLNISNETASFVLPIGATVNMDGTSCYQSIAAVFLAQVIGIDLTLTQMLTIILTTTLSSIGTPGIPGGSIVMVMIVLSSIGIPIESLALIIGIDRPLDMLRTVTNVTGDTTVACIVDDMNKD